MSFVCEECGLTRSDEDKHTTIDGISTKEICSRCLDPNTLVLSSMDEEEVNRRILEAYKPKRFSEKPAISLEKIKLRSYATENEFRRKIRLGRIDLGLTTEQLAEIIGVDAKSIDMFEKGLKEDFYIRKKLIDFFERGGKEDWLMKKKSVEEEFFSTEKIEGSQESSETAEKDEFDSFEKWSWNC